MKKLRRVLSLSLAVLITCSSISAGYVFAKPSEEGVVQVEGSDVVDAESADISLLDESIEKDSEVSISEPQEDSDNMDVDSIYEEDGLSQKDESDEHLNKPEDVSKDTPKIDKTPDVGVSIGDMGSSSILNEESSGNSSDIESLKESDNSVSSLDYGFDTEFYIPSFVGEPVGSAYLHTPYEDGSLDSGDELDLSNYVMRRQSRAVGDTVQIVKGDTFSYNGWSTSIYNVMGNETYLGVCAEPSKASPSGTYTVSALNDEVIKALLYAFTDSGYRESLFGSTSYQQQFINMHTTIGYRYSGDLKGADAGTIQGAKNVIAFIENTFIPTYRSELAKVSAYVALNDKQDIVWIEKRSAVSLSISKRSYTDLSTNSGLKNLTGAVFELWAYDGSKYSTKIATSVDNGDGSYTFKNIYRDSAVDGLFLIKEVKAPDGYTTPYYFYTSKDKSHFNNYGGRVFKLDGNMIWSCISTESLNGDSHFGFSFLNKPKANKLTITKYEANKYDVLLTGAIFDLWAWSSDTNDYTVKVGELTDNGDGTYSISFPFDYSSLKDGKYSYQLKEVKAPDGYFKSSVAREFNYDLSGNLLNDVEDLKYPNMKYRGGFKIKKSSANEDITSGNNCYSLKGAEYTVYSDEACTTLVNVDKLVTDDYGDTNVISLPVGTYYVKETKAPRGYVLDSKVYKVDITKTYANILTKTLNVNDNPKLDPVGILLKKIDADTGESVGTGGLSLGGAEFTVKYYDVISPKIAGEHIDPGASGYTPKKTWVFKTDDDGFTYYSKDFLVDGDDLFYTPNGDASIPFGTVTIQETKAPEGYYINDEVFVVPISEDATGGVITYNEPIIPETAKKLKLKKVDNDTGASLKGATFEHTKPDGSKTRMVVNDSGELTIVGLSNGTHTIREVIAPDGYYINSNVIQFTVSDDNIVIDSKSHQTETSGKITMEVTEEGVLDIVVRDKPIKEKYYSLKVMKVNGFGNFLPGAEFTLYGDTSRKEVISTAVADRYGVLVFDSLEYGREYVLVETEAPEGYVLPDKEIAYTFSAFYDDTVVKEGIFYYVNGTMYDLENNNTSDNIFLTGNYDDDDLTINIKVVNTYRVPLPETGSGLTAVMIGFGVILMAVALLVINKSKNKK